MTWKLFLDDERDPVFTDWIVCRTAAEAQYLCCKNGTPTAMSLDHDLGFEQPTGYDFVKWIVEQWLDNKLTMPEGFEYYVHSQNPVGAKNINSLLDNYIESCVDMHHK